MAKNKRINNAPHPLAVPPPLKPQDTPVSIYADPLIDPPAPTNDLLELAQGLRGMTPGVTALADRFVEDEYRRGMADEWANGGGDRNQKYFASAVRRGEVRFGKSPWAKRGAEIQRLRLAANDYAASLERAWAESEAKTSDRREDLQNWTEGFTEKFLDDRGIDPTSSEFDEVMPLFAQAEANLVRLHYEYRTEETERVISEQTEVEVRQLLSSGTDHATAGQKIAQAVEAHRANGLSGTKANALTAEAVVRHAIDTLDSDVLNVLDHIPTGPGATLGGIGYVKDLRREAESTIFTEYERTLRHNAHAQEKAEKAEVARIQGEAFVALLDDPNADIKPQLRALAKIDPEKANAVAGWKAARISASDDLAEDEGIALELEAAVQFGRGDVDAIMAAATKNKISLSTARRLMADHAKADTFRTAIKHPVVAELHRALGQAIRKGDEGFSDELGIAAVRAQNGYLAAMAKWLNEKPRSESEVIAEAQKVQEGYLKLFAPTAFKTSTEKVTDEDVSSVVPNPNEWATKPLFTRDELKQAVAIYNESKGTSGPLVEMATKLGIKPGDLAQAQMRLITTPKKKTE